MEHYSSPIVRREDEVDLMDGVAMLRDAERLARALIQTIQDSFSEQEAESALGWLGIIDQSIEGSSASNSAQ